MLLIFLATNSPGMLHPSSAGPVPEPGIIVMFFTQLQVHKASNSTPARITKVLAGVCYKIETYQRFPSFQKGEQGEPMSTSVFGKQE